MTSLVPQVDKIRDDADLTEILRSLSEAQGSKPEAKAAESVSTATEPVRVGEDTLKAISRLHKLLRAVEVPSERRTVTLDEAQGLMDLAEAAKAAKKGAKQAEAVVKKAIYNHFDVLIEHEDDLPVDKDGHYLVADEIEVPGTGKKFARELRETQPVVTEEDLRKLRDNGVISNREYMQATRHVDSPREVDNDGLAALLKSKRDLLPKIADILVPGEITSAFYVRDVKVKKGSRK